MRIVFAASTVATVALIASGALGVAGAETTPTTTTPAPIPLRVVSVEGIATEPIDQSATAATATAVYRQGMSDAVTDGQAKAQFLAGKGGAALGPVQSMIEGGGYIGCASGIEYLGEQPDFGSPGSSGNRLIGVGAPTAQRAAGNRKATAKHPKHPKHSSAKKANAGGCTLSTQVSLAYSLN